MLRNQLSNHRGVADTITASAISHKRNQSESAAPGTAFFSQSYAHRLGLDLTSGTRQGFRTAAGSFWAYGHEITLLVGEMQWVTTVYFAEPEDFPVNVVGRIGFFDHTQIGLVDYEQMLYLNPYAATSY